jgi:sugar lactone lactonase YvrE
MNKEIGIECVFNEGATCGESPLWDDKQKVLYWVDIPGKTINCFDPSTRSNQSWNMDEEVGSIALRENGGLIAGMRSGFAFIDMPSANVTYIADPEPDHPENRLNDGRCDRSGRFWVGSMHVPKSRSDASLYRLDANLSYQKLTNNLIVSNGLGFSPDGTRMYHSDSRQSTIWCYDYDSSEGTPHNKRVFAKLTPQQGRPDGAAVDSEGFYWSCCYAGGRLIRFAPDGSIDREISLPVINVTMCAFGGHGYEDLYVTTAAEHMTEEERLRYPNAGGLFLLHTGVKGVPETRFKG